MKRAMHLLAGLVVLGMAGCGSKSPIVGKWNVSVVSDSESDKETSETFYNYGFGEKVYAAEVENGIKSLSGGDSDDADLPDWIKFEVGFRRDGTCSVQALPFADMPAPSKEEVKWTLNGDKLTQSYRGKVGKPGTVVWESPDKFMLVRHDRPPFRFEREK
jgi:hypothetical protein